MYAKNFTHSSFHSRMISINICQKPLWIYSVPNVCHVLSLCTRTYYQCKHQRCTCIIAIILSMSYVVKKTCYLWKRSVTAYISRDVLGKLGRDCDYRYLWLLTSQQRTLCGATVLWVFYEFVLWCSCIVLFRHIYSENKYKIFK